MRSNRFFFVAGALLLPALAMAQTAAIGGTTVNTGCSAAIPDPAEFYAIKVTPSPTDARSDWLFDLTAKGGQASDTGTVYTTGAGWAVAPNWRVGQGDPHVHYGICTFAPTGPGQPGRFSIDSATIADFNADIVRVQEVGNSIPAGNLNSIGLTIPGTSAAINVQLRPAVTKSFPKGTTTNGINIAFAQVIDVNNNDSTGSSCPWGAQHPDPLDTTDVPATRGVIIGYNVYRVPGSAGTVPTPADFKAALSDADPASGWVGFMDVRTLHQIVADPNPPAGPAPSPLETAPTADLAGIQNPNGTAYDGDEVMIFQDSVSAPNGSPRPGGGTLAPTLTQSYWYAAQPVASGKVSDFNNLGFTNNLFFTGDHRCDIDGDGQFDGVDLDATTCTVATMDFISPQAEYGLDGLGLTNNSLPLLSSPQFFDSSVALPASGQISLSGTASGTDVNLQFSTGLERGSVLGYNVYRQVGENRVRVNEQPILAQGSESNVYRVVDAAVASARGARVSSVQYMVEIVYSDGTPSSFVGPFAVQMDQQAPGRRRR